MKPNTLDHKPVWEKASDEQKQKFYKTLENGQEKVKVENALWTVRMYTATSLATC